MGWSSFLQGERLRILSPEEHELLLAVPRFTQSDRDLLFTLTAPERGAVDQCRSVRTKTHLLLHPGDFRARQRIFRFELPAVRNDVDHLRRRYFDNVVVAERVIAQVELSAESVRYYASFVELDTVYKVKRMDREAARLYLLCFVRERYQRLTDNLLGALCTLVRRYAEEVDAATKEASYRF